MRMKIVTKAVYTSVVLALFLGSNAGFAQKTDFAWSPDPMLPSVEAAPYALGIHSGARQVSGPFDLDNDGKVDILVSDYSGAGRVHMLESTGTDTWELVYSSPVLQAGVGTTNNLRTVTGADLDGDGMGEIVTFAGVGLSEDNPFVALGLRRGMIVLEASGDNEFSLAALTLYDFDEFADGCPDRWRQEQLTAIDIDGDGRQELLFGNNGGANACDNWYVISMTGEVGPFATFNVEARWSSRASEEFDPVNRGGGSAYGMVPADLDGDGMHEIAMQSWNNFNFTNARATGPDTYEAPDSGDNVFLQAAAGDHVALFGCTATDMDGNGDDEVFCPNLQTGNAAILNYESGEDALRVTEDNVVLELLPAFSGLGITAGDLDGDGTPELIGSGPSYTHGTFAADEPPVWVRIAKFMGGDVEDPMNYSVLPVPSMGDLVNTFDKVVRDSAGTMTEFFENGAQGPEFTAKLAYLGDPDNDGMAEVAISMQGVDDSLYTYMEVFNAADTTYTRTTTSVTAHPNRVFLRVLSVSDLSTNIVDERVIVPSDYVLHGNYPNPFNPSTTFSFTLPIDKRISIRIYDLSGRVVRTLVNNESFAAGTHQATWDGRSDGNTPVASGTYLYTLEYGNFRQSKSMLLIK